MRVTIACDKFKGTFSAAQAGQLIARGLSKRHPNISTHVHPMADGGEGTAAILANAMNMEARTTPCLDLLGRPIEPSIFWQNEQRIALIESAFVVGSHLSLPSPSNLAKSASRGLGRLYREALALRPKEIWIALGGTATADGGWGFASELGLEARDQNGQILIPCLENMNKISSFELGPDACSATETKTVLLCDVSAPAAPLFEVSLASFLPQKGAEAAQVADIVATISAFARSLLQFSATAKEFNASFTAAAGGMIFGISAMLNNVHIKKGAEVVALHTRLEDIIAQSDLVICGEGRLDSQTLFGKTAAVVSEIATKQQVPLVGVFGQIRDGNGCEDLREKLNAKRLYALFQEPPANWRQLERESESRLVEAGIDIAHRFLGG